MQAALRPGGAPLKPNKSQVGSKSQYKPHALAAISCALFFQGVLSWGNVSRSTPMPGSKNSVPYYSAEAPKFLVLLAGLLLVSSKEQVISTLKNPCKAYSWFALLVLSTAYVAFGDEMQDEDYIGYCSCLMEAYGLVAAAMTIQSHQNVAGVSGNSMIMLTISFVFRSIEPWLFGGVQLTYRGMLLEFFQAASIPLAFCLVWLVHVTYSESYHESADKVELDYLMPLCLLVPIVLRPNMSKGIMYSYCWTASFYVDTLALLPQAVLTRAQGKQGGVPLACFVAANGISRACDLWFWYIHFDMGEQGKFWGFNYSGWIVVIFHVMNLILVADLLFQRVRYHSYHAHKLKDCT